jgi:hypothetical protein
MSEVRFFKVTTLGENSVYDSEDEDAAGYLLDQVYRAIQENRGLYIQGLPRMTIEEYKSLR